MRKSKILGIALAAAMVSSVVVTAAFSVSADEAQVTSAGIADGNTVGITGSFNGWANGKDVPMTNNNGVWEGTIQVDNVTEDMVGVAQKDDGTGNKVDRTDITGKAITFKVRLNGEWTHSWGDFEPDFDRTWNSQTDCAVAAEVGKPITINVKLDTTKCAAGSSITDPADGDAWQVWPVEYSVVESAAPAEESKEEESKEEESKEEESKAEESKEEESKAEESKPAEEPSEDSAPVETGDAASAAALVAVVLASLGTAVVMTKKASAKD